MTLKCTGNSVSLAISWLAMSSTYDMTDVQLGLASRSSPFASFLSQTTDGSSLLINDLPPGTDFAVALRQRLNRGDRAWTNLTDPIACSTAALLPLQPHVLPPTTPPALDSVTLTVRLSQPKAHLDVQYRKQGDVAWRHAKVSPLRASLPTADVSLLVSGLDPDEKYDIRVQAVWPSQSGPRMRAPFSDIVTVRTASAGSQLAPPLEVYRVTEHCGDSCHPDLLHNHNAGDLLADVSFITAMSDPGARPNPFIRSFDIVSVTKYCVSRVPLPFADYISCNGVNPELTQCACNNYIDRCIGRMDEGPAGFGSAACDISGCENDTSGMPLCSCTESSMSASQKGIGAMPVFHPFPRELQEEGGTLKPLRSCTVPPRAESSFLGQWYSFPAEAECPPDRLPAGECSWSRLSWQHFVRGSELLSLGFNTSASQRDVAQLHQNAAVIIRAFARIPRTERCCGC
jgi:hypothetical protein